MQHVRRERVNHHISINVHDPSKITGEKMLDPLPKRRLSQPFLYGFLMIDFQLNLMPLRPSPQTGQKRLNPWSIGVLPCVADATLTRTGFMD